jgi:DNA polymerase I-like protein with 3'-5' exonuclease and polymerase domains
LFIPDFGHVFFDMDLDRADLQVVVWEADDEDLKRRLRLGVDLHLANGLELEGKPIPPEEELIDGHPNYPEHLARFKRERKFAKSWVHGTNYGGSARTMAINCGITVAQSERFQHRWFSMHPGIKRWHLRTEAQLRTKRFVTNKFGYRRYYFDRVDSLLPEALAWQPQSTVALYINLIWMRFFLNIPELQVLLQAHDSLAGQFPYHLRDWVIGQMKKEASNVIIPYDDPLVIPVGIKHSQQSWGDCE